VLASSLLGVLLACFSVPPVAGQASSIFLDTFDAAWQLILDTHFDTDMNGIDWDQVREELRPQAAAARSEAELRSVLEEMIGRLGQSHFALIPGAGVDAAAEEETSAPADIAAETESVAADGPATEVRSPACDDELNGRVLDILQGVGDLAAAGVGMAVRDVDGEMVVTRVAEGSAAAEADVQPGETLRRVGHDQLDRAAVCFGESVTEHERGTLLNTVVSALLAGDPGSMVELELEDSAGSRRVASLERRLPSDAIPVRFGNLPPLPTRLEAHWLERGDRRVAVIRFNIWMVPIAPRFEEAVATMRDADGFVLDLRGNPGGVAALAQGIAGYFVDRADSLGTIKSRRDELELRINPRRVLAGGERFQPYAGPLAILVDSGTGSTSEIFAAGLQDLGRARLFGEPTAGAALPAQAKRLPNGDVLLHATGDFIRPSGRRIEGQPVVPDEVVPLTRSGLRAGHDEPLDAAARWIVGLERAGAE